MRTLRIMEHVSLDGVMQHSALGDGFPYSGWTNPYRTPAGLELVLAAYGDSFDLLLGRRTYDSWSDLWANAPSSPMADGIKSATKFVATHHPDTLEWGPVEAVGADLLEGVRRIKSDDGPDIVVAGSSTLTSVLLESELVDEVVLAIYPVLLGTGQRFFAEGTPARELAFASTVTTPTGVLLTTYTYVGPLPAG